MQKHTYFSNRSGYLEHSYDCKECKNIARRKNIIDNIMWVIACAIIFIVVSGCSKLKFDPKTSLIKYSIKKADK